MWGRIVEESFSDDIVIQWIFGWCKTIWWWWGRQVLRSGSGGMTEAVKNAFSWSVTWRSAWRWEIFGWDLFSCEEGVQDALPCNVLWCSGREILLCYCWWWVSDQIQDSLSRYEIVTFLTGSWGYPIIWGVPSRIVRFIVTRPVLFVLTIVYRLARNPWSEWWNLAESLDYLTG